MSNKTTITVASIDQRPVKTRYGDKSAWNVRGTDGSKIDFAFKSPASLGVMIGGTYEVLTNMSKYGPELEKGTIPTNLGVSTGPAASSAYSDGNPPAAVCAPSERAGTRFPLEPTDPHNIQVRESALTSAVRFWENRAIPATVDEKAQAEEVIKTAYLFADFITGQREAKAVESFAPTEEPMS